MASSPHLPTPSRNRSIQPELSPRTNPEIAGISHPRSHGQPKNYFQPINDHNTHNGQHHPVIAAPSTVASQNEAFSVYSFEAENVLDVPDVTPPFFSPQTPSPVPSCLLPRCDSPLTTGNSSTPPDIGILSYSPTPSSSAPLVPKAAPKTPSPQLLLPSLEAVSSPYNTEELQIQLGQSTEHASSARCPDLLFEDVEVTSSVFHHEGTDLKLVCGSSPEAADQASNTECIQQNEDELGRVSKENKMNFISDKGLTSGANFLEPYTNNSDLHSTLHVSINPKVPVNMMSEENVKAQVSLKSTTALPVFTSAEASLEMTPVPEEPTPAPDISMNQVEYNQPDLSYLSSHMPTNTSEAKSGELVDYMSVLYLQVTKAVQDETQRPSDHNQSNQSVVSSTLIPNVDQISGAEPLLLEGIKDDGLQNKHEEQRLKHMGKGQRNTPVVLDSKKENFACKVPRNICPPVSQGPLEPASQALPTHWTPQSVSGANYTNYYGCVYPDYQNSGPPFSDQHSVHYPWAQNPWMHLRGYYHQSGSEAQFYGQKQQKKKCQLKQLEQSSSEHTRDLNEPTPERQKRPKDRSASADQDTISSQGWDSQGYYSPAYYKGYYYPYNYGYNSEFSKKHSQPYHTMPDKYDDRWRYDPRYDSTFDRDHFAQYEQSYGDQCDRQSCYSGYSTQSMPSTHSNDSLLSWHSEQTWGYQHLQHADYPTYGTSAHSHHDAQDPLENEPRNHYTDTASSSKSEMSSEEHGPANEKFSTPHCCARFGPGGQLIQVLPNLPSEGKPAVVQIHSTEMVLQGLWDQLELNAFPGPLTKDKTSKEEVLAFIKNKCLECLQNDTQTDGDVSHLIWELMRLICRQNGNLVGTDVSRLLLRNQRSQCSFKKATADLIDFTHEPLSRELENQMGNAESTTANTEKDMQHFREMVIAGKKNDALKTAVSKGLWGHAFMLASKMDTRAYSQVMSKFIDSLSESDALRTFYQLMSGRIPVSAVNCRFKEQEDWRIHLAMVLSNHTCFKHLHKKTITKMGDTLASKGCSDTASFCYMVAQLDVDTQSEKSDVFLFGVSPNSVPHLKYASNEAIQRTELFEYSLSLGTNFIYLPNFQVFKFIYACRLAEAGLYTQAFQYCEVIAKALLTTGAGSSLALISQLLELSAKIRHFDQQLKDIPEHELQCEPEWMVNLKILHSQFLEQINSSICKEQDTDLLPEKTEIMDISTDNTDIVECNPSYEVSILTTEMPKQEDSPPQVQLALPASQDILESRTKAAPVESRQVLDSDPPEPDIKALPLDTCPDSQKPSHPANANSLPEGDPTLLGMEPKALCELQLLTVPPPAALLPEKLVHTETAHCLSEDQPNQTTKTTPPLVLSLLAPPTLPQMHLFVTDSTIAQSQCTENLQYLPGNIDFMSAEFTEPTCILPSATLPSSLSLVTESELLPQKTVPLPYTPSFAQSGQPYKRQQPILQPSVPVAPPPLSSGSINWVTEWHSREIQPVLPSSPPLQYEPLVCQPLHPATSNDRSPAVYTMESQTAPLLTMPLPASHIPPPSSSAYSAKPSLHAPQAQFGPPVTSRLPADRMFDQKTLPLFDKKPYVMAEKTVHPGQMHAAPKPIIPKLFVPQSPVPDPQPKKEAGGGWFSWLFRKKSEVNSATGIDKSDAPNVKR